MKTLLISINTKYIHSSLSVWYLKSSVSNPIHDIEIIESTVKISQNNLLSEIASANAKVIGFSTYIWNIEYIKEILPLVREQNPNAVIILGGPEVSYNASSVLAELPCVDYVICGEGEEIFPLFIERIKNNLSPIGISGVNSIDFSSPAHTNQNEPISPYTSEYFDRLKGRIAYIETSRGCPYSCSYCLSGRLCKIKFFSLDRVKKDIEALSISGAKTIKFIDRTFNCNEKRAIEIIKFIIENTPVYSGICFHFEMAGDIISEDLINILKTAPVGLIQIEVGVQSLNQKTLELVNRKTNTDILLSNMQKLIKNNNIHIHMDLIAGLPGENYQSFKHSFNELFKIRPHMLQLGFLKLLHGSPLEKENCGNFNNKAPYEIIQNDFLTQEDVQKLKFTEDALERLYNSGRFKNLIETILYKHDVTAFDLFYEFGNKYKLTYGTKLEDLCSYVLEHFQKYISTDELLDIMRVEWIRTNSSGNLPVCLKGFSMGTLLKTLDKNVLTRRKQSVKRAAVPVENSSKIVYVDYQNKNPVTGYYPFETKCL